MSKKLLILLVTIGVALLFASTGLYAGTAPPDTIHLYEKAFKKHKKGPVAFPHKKHIEEYKLKCGECHHDANHKPLNNLKMTDDVKPCIACHKATKRVRGEKLSKKEKIKKYYEYAMHENCKSCHKAFNKKKTGKVRGPAPTSCNQCHAKKKKK